MDDINLGLFPDKIFYKIGEASRLSGVEPHVLRQWEIDFQELKPHKTKSGQRLYTKNDIELIINIHRFLTVEGYSKQGVKAKLLQLNQNYTKDSDTVLKLKLAIATVKKRLKDIYSSI